MLKNKRFYGFIALSLAAGCNVVAAHKDYRPDISILTAVSMLNKANHQPKVDECPRCDGRGKYSIADTSKWQDPCDVCGGTGKSKPSAKRKKILSSAPQKINWQPLSKIQLNNKGKPTWVHFVSESCPPCKALEKGIFKNKQFINETRNINCVQILVPSDASIIWGVRATPTDVWVNKDWKILGRQNPPDSEYFLDYFKNWKRKLNVK